MMLKLNADNIQVPIATELITCRPSTRCFQNLSPLVYRGELAMYMLVANWSIFGTIFSC